VVILTQKAMAHDMCHMCEVNFVISSIMCHYLEFQIVILL
jgi:hypothetical protein